MLKCSRRSHPCASMPRSHRCAGGPGRGSAVELPPRSRCQQRQDASPREAGHKHVQARGPSLTVCRASAAAAGAGGGSRGRGAFAFLDANFIPIALLSAITLGWLNPAPGAAAAALNLQVASTIGIFIISGVLLQRGEAVAALQSPAALAFGLCSILLVTPLLAFAALALPLRPPEMALGLAVFCCVPTTLSTCVTLTNSCRGNAAVALLLVVASNVLGVFTIPLVLSVVLGAGAGATSFHPAALFRNLVVTVLLPLVAGVGLQVVVPGLPAWRSHNRKLLAYISTFFLCLVPWMQLSVAASSNLALTPASVAAAAAAGAALHLVFLAFNTLAASKLQFNADRDQNDAIRKAVVLCASEKTLPVAVAVINQLSAVAGAAAGFAVVPCCMAHLMQIAIDSALVARWNRAEEAAVRAATAA